MLTTILFTDIVGSTARAASSATRAGGAARRAPAVVRRELARFRGREIDTAGDGFLATFDGPARAIRCARGPSATPCASSGSSVRAGVHTGEVELDGEHVRGIAVHTGARIAALAAPGEVLVSSTVRDLVAGSGLAFDDRGEHELKGVPGSWRLFAVAE